MESIPQSGDEAVRMRVKQPVIHGTIIDTRYNKSEKQLEHLLLYDGTDHVERWFLESQLEPVPAP